MSTCTRLRPKPPNTQCLFTNVSKFFFPQFLDLYFSLGVEDIVRWQENLPSLARPTSGSIFSTRKKKSHECWQSNSVNLVPTPTEFNSLSLKTNNLISVAKSTVLTFWGHCDTFSYRTCLGNANITQMGYFLISDYKSNAVLTKHPNITDMWLMLPTLVKSSDVLWLCLLQDSSTSGRLQCSENGELGTEHTLHWLFSWSLSLLVSKCCMHAASLWGPGGWCWRPWCGAQSRIILLGCQLHVYHLLAEKPCKCDSTVLCFFSSPCRTQR